MLWVARLVERPAAALTLDAAGPGTLRPGSPATRPACGPAALAALRPKRPSGRATRPPRPPRPPGADDNTAVRTAGGGGVCGHLAAVSQFVKSWAQGGPQLFMIPKFVGQAIAVATRKVTLTNWGLPTNQPQAIKICADAAKAETRLQADKPRAGRGAPE